MSKQILLKKLIHNYCNKVDLVDKELNHNLQWHEFNSITLEFPCDPTHLSFVYHESKLVYG